MVCLVSIYQPKFVFPSPPDNSTLPCADPKGCHIVLVTTPTSNGSWYVKYFELSSLGFIFKSESYVTSTAPSSSGPILAQHI